MGTTVFLGTSIKCARDKWSSRPFFFAIGWPRGWSGSLTKRLSNHTLQQIVPKNWSEWFAKGNFAPVFSHYSSSSSGALKSRTWAKSFCTGLFFLKRLCQENDQGWHAKKCQTRPSSLQQADPTNKFCWHLQKNSVGLPWRVMLIMRKQNCYTELFFHLGILI